MAKGKATKQAVAFPSNQVNLEDFGVLNVVYLGLRYSLGFARRCWLVMLLLAVFSFGAIYGLLQLFPSLNLALLEPVDQATTFGSMFASPQLWVQVAYDVITKPIIVGLLMLALAHLRGERLKVRSVLTYYAGEKFLAIAMVILPTALLKQAVISAGLILASQGFTYGQTAIVVSTLLLSEYVGLVAMCSLLQRFDGGDDDLKRAVLESWRRLGLNWWRVIFVIVLSYVLVIVLGMASMAIGLIWLIPMFFMMTAVLYRYLFHGA